MSMFRRIRDRRLFDLHVRTHPTWYTEDNGMPSKGWCTATWTTVLFGTRSPGSIFEIRGKGWVIDEHQATD